MKLTTISTLLLAATAAAQGNGLLFVTRGTEQTAQCPPLTALCRADANEVELVVPRTAPYTARAFAPRVGYDVMTGDNDLDASYYEPGQFRGIDAIQPSTGTAGIPMTNARSLWFSPIAKTAVLGGGAFEPADVGRFLPGGALERFLSANMLYDAFRIPSTTLINLDAIAVHVPTGIYVSFEDTVTISIATGVFTVEDGAILRIPPAAITWAPSPYDGAIRVVNVAVGSGQIVAMEPEVSAWVANSGIRDRVGGVAGVITDTDGLEIDPSGGVFFSQWVGGNLPNLLVTGERLTGAGVITTRAGGAIAQLNGIPLGNAVGATTGTQVGLVTPAGVGTLNGLGIVQANQRHFAAETPTPVIAGAGMLTVELGGMPPAAAVCHVFINFGVAGAGLVDPCIPFPGGSFPELYVMHHLAALPIGPDGCAAVNVPISAALHASLAGGRVLFQGYYFDGANQLSTPLGVHFN